MILPPILTQKLQAEMRTAFTQACVRFPNGLYLMPVHDAVAKCFMYTAKFMGSTYYMMDTRVYGEILSIVQLAEDRIHSRDSLASVLSGKSVEEARKLRPLVRGLDVNSGNILAGMARSGHDRMHLSRTAALMLQNHRNNLANQIVSEAVDRAGLLFAYSERGDAGGQSLGTERRARSSAG